MKNSREKNLESILVLAAGFMILSLVFGVVWLSVIAIGASVLELISDKAGGKVVWLWMKLAEILGWVMSRVLLSAIFFLVLTPIAAVYRLSKKDPLELKRQVKPSLFHAMDKRYQPADLENIW